MANTVLDTVDITTNRFRDWVTKTNDAITVLRNQSVTTTNTINGDTVTGNGYVVGILGANTLVATTLRGGTVNSIANLAITTNTNITAAYVNVTSNTYIYSNSSIAAAIFIGNSTATNTSFNSTYYNVNSNLALIGVAHTVTGNVNVDSGTLFVDSLNNRIGINTTSPNNSLTVVGNTLITGILTTPYTMSMSNSATTTGTSQVAIDSFAAATYRSAKYTLSITDNVNSSTYQTSEVLVMHDGTNAYVTEYAVLRSNSSVGTMAADISGGNVRLLITPVSANNTIKFERTLVVV